jgi:hypothetical protein
MRLRRFLPALLGLLLWPALLGACSQVPLPLGGDDADVIAADAFDPTAADRWLLEGDDLSRAYLASEKLITDVNGPELVHYSVLVEKGFDDFTLEVDATQLAGPPRSSYGILFRMAENGAFYRFAVLPAGYYQVELHQADGSRLSLTDGWVATDHVNQGLNQVNRLKVTTFGTSLAFFINGVFQTELSESSLVQGGVALEAGSFTSGGVQVAFDNLLIRRREQ